MFLFLSLVCYHSVGQSYFNYYKIVNTAENHILKLNFDSSLHFYKQAFRLNYAFGKDYYNASICALKTNNKKLCREYLLELANKGLNFEYLKSKLIFNSILNKKVFNNSYKAKYDAFFRKNQDIRNTLDSLVIADQYLRKKIDFYQNPDLYKKEVRVIDSSNAKSLLKLINKIGCFPNESIVGLGDSLTSSPLFDLIIWHQGDKTKQSFNFANILENAIMKGEILPDRASLLIQLNDGKKNFQNDIVYKVNFLDDSLLSSDEFRKNNQWLYKIWALKKKGLNELRYSMGLCSISEYVAKVKYTLFNNEPFVFFSQVTFPTYQVNDLESAKQLLKNGTILR